MSTPSKLVHRHDILPANRKGRDFFVGDIHGMHDHLMRAMDEADFDDTCDRIISTGDLIDRGPDSIKLLTLLQHDWFYAVRGNHEEMFLDTDPAIRVMHHKYGGDWIDDLSDDEIDQYRTDLHKLPVAISVQTPDDQTIGVCHAEWPNGNWAKVDKALTSEKTAQQMVWGRTRIKSGLPQRDKSAALLIHGHSPVPEPCRMGDALFIDTGCVYGGPLTFIELQQALAMKANIPHRPKSALKKGLSALSSLFD